MKKELYLECPQCRARGYFVTNQNGEKAFFYVNYDKKPVKTKFSEAELEDGLDFSIISCASCSWKGGINKLKKITEE